MPMDCMQEKITCQNEQECELGAVSNRSFSIIFDIFWFGIYDIKESVMIFVYTNDIVWWSPIRTAVYTQLFHVITETIRVRQWNKATYHLVLHMDDICWRQVSTSNKYWKRALPYYQIQTNTYINQWKSKLPIDTVHWGIDIFHIRP